MGFSRRSPRGGEVNGDLPRRCISLRARMRWSLNMLPCQVGPFFTPNTFNGSRVHILMTLTTLTTFGAHHVRLIEQDSFQVPQLIVSSLGFLVARGYSGVLLGDSFDLKTRMGSWGGVCLDQAYIWLASFRAVLSFLATPLSWVMLMEVTSSSYSSLSMTVSRPTSFWSLGSKGYPSSYHIL